MAWHRHAIMLHRDGLPARSIIRACPTPGAPHFLQVELQEIVDFFQKPERFRQSGSRIPRGVLLCGPPGTGKTLLARWGLEGWVGTYLGGAGRAVLFEKAVLWWRGFPPALANRTLYPRPANGSADSWGGGRGCRERIRCPAVCARKLGGLPLSPDK